VVPPWAPEIRDFSIPVKVNDEKGTRELGFTIGEVAPECRWAIDPDTGIVMTNAQFREKFPLWYNAHYTMRPEPVEIEGEPLSIPGVIEFVSKKVHPNDITKLVPMGFDPDRPVTATRAEIENRVLHYPEIRAGEDTEDQKRANESASKMEVLIKLHDEGVLSDEQFAEQSKSIYGGSVVVGEEGTDSSEPSVAEPLPEEAPMTHALCGKTVKVKGKHLHELRCGACAKVRDAEEQSGEGGEEES